MLFLADKTTTCVLGPPSRVEAIAEFRGLRYTEIGIKNMRISKVKVNFSKYKGKEVAIVKGKIVASGNSSKDVFEKARKKFPKISSKDIVLLYVPKEKFAIYNLKK